jgi:hypothetical protein
MDLHLPDDELLRRSYRIDGGDEGELIVSIKRPFSTTPGGPYMCRYEIIGLGQNRKHGMQGADAIDALLNALSLIGSWLKGINESEFHGLLTWGGAEPGNIGFPTIEDHWPTGPIDRGERERDA